MDESEALLIAAALFSSNQDSQFYQDSKSAIDAAFELLDEVKRRLLEREIEQTAVQKRADNFILKQNIDRVTGVTKQKKKTK